MTNKHRVKMMRRAHRKAAFEVQKEWVRQIFSLEPDGRRELDSLFTQVREVAAFQNSQKSAQ